MTLRLNNDNNNSANIDYVDGVTTDSTITITEGNGTLVTNNFTGDVSINGDLSFNSGFGSAGQVFGCRAWVNFNGDDTTAGETMDGVRASGNISGVERLGSGWYRIHFTNDMPDANYVVTGLAGREAADATRIVELGHNQFAVGSFEVQTRQNIDNDSEDAFLVCLAVFR